jgi:hypothetical protein
MFYRICCVWVTANTTAKLYANSYALFNGFLCLLIDVQTIYNGFFEKQTTVTGRKTAPFATVPRVQESILSALNSLLQRDNNTYVASMQLSVLLTHICRGEFIDITFCMELLKQHKHTKAIVVLAHHITILWQINQSCYRVVIPESDSPLEFTYLYCIFFFHTPVIR